MRGPLAPLSPHEEAALLRIGFGNQDALEHLHVWRLLRLELIEWSDRTWRLTALGRQRCGALFVDGNGRPRPAA